MAVRSWGLPPSEFWGMTIAEVMTEVMSMDTGQTYAGNMTAGEIEAIKAESAELREQIAKKKAKQNGTASS